MFEMTMLPGMEMQVTPTLVSLTQMLTLPSMELHQLVQQELDENPALEEIDTAPDAEPLEQPQDIEPLSEPGEDDESSEWTLATTAEEQRDPLQVVAAPCSLADYLLDDLRASIAIEDYTIALCLVGSLDERGFLTEEPESLAQMLGACPQRVGQVLERLRELGPPGIAARSVRECLLAQIDSLASGGIFCPHVREIVNTHLDDLGARRYKQIARSLHIGINEVKAAHTFVQQHLWPYPAYTSSGAAVDLHRPSYTVPDVIITQHNGKYVVEMQHAPYRVLRISPTYRHLARRSTSLDTDERAHVQEYVARARVFLRNLRQREHILQQVTEAVVSHQEKFLQHGVRFLAPLTRSEIAAEIGVHESTVSRATSGKTVLLPSRVPVPFSTFFSSHLHVQDVMRELITSEAAPLSDQEIVALLNGRGYQVARRTVAKYRNRMGILPSKLR